MKNMKSEKLFAFWDYAQYPYFLGGTITEMKDDGTVETEEYGKGYYFKPVFFLPLEEGKNLRTKLEKLNDEFLETKESLRKQYITKLNSLLNGFGRIR